MNGIQEASGSIPLISTKQEELTVYLVNSSCFFILHCSGLSPPAILSTPYLD
ncbi:hypothetical protein KL86SPO_30857 [uncultured Sporomusa sp.]|uniref:Uncharacterized protein n=1 Tax=uncultured Sporomusa sp. TaxID=307249 RepID=A0A212LTH1_9FIRM|nr:hypothetical protein KL86SPO_30857 [uncultured Sporomusa sp.]